MPDSYEGFVSPEYVLREIYPKTALELGIPEKRRDELIAAAIFASFRNHEFGTHLLFRPDYHEMHPEEDARGIDIILEDPGGRKKNLQIKGVYIQRSIARRIYHAVKGSPRVTGRRTRRQIKKDSKELTAIMRGELTKIIHDYSGLILIIHVIADLATQTSLEIAIRKSRKIVANLKAKEVWFLRHIPVRALDPLKSLNCHAYKLIKVSPDRHTYAFSFSV